MSRLLFCLLLSPLSQAALPPGYKMVLLTENFPPFNMAEHGKNFARDAQIRGVSADTVREMFKRAGIDYSLTLRFPWDRIYKQAMTTPNHGLFSTSLSEARKPLFKWVGPIAQYQSVLVGLKGSSPQLDNLELGWRFKRESWGYGFASEAAHAVAEAVARHAAAFATPVQAFSALAVPDNLPSIAVMKRLGMQFVSQRLHQDPMWTAEIVEYRKTLTPDRLPL